MGGQPLRILQVLRAPVGGLFRHVSDLTQALAERGHEIGLVVDSLTADGLTEQRLATLAPAVKLGIHHAPMPRMFGPGDVITPFKIRRLADSLGIEVLHGHGAKGGLSARAARIGARGRVALYTLHGGVLNYRPGSMIGGTFRMLERVLLAQTDAVIFESEFAQDTFRKVIASPTCPVPVVHNGLKPSEFVPVALQPDPYDFVFIGEFRPVKGIDYLLEALVEVKAPDGRPATLIMAGSGPGVGRAEEQIARLGLGDRVHLAGVQPARQMLARGRYVVVPSLAESLPYVILEAASAQRPVIATDVGGVGEIFGPTSQSLLPAADAAALRQAMQAYMDDPAAAQREMEVRLEFIRSRFSVELMTDQIEAVYRQVLATRRGDPSP
jgi:glycosyltransferase involved in cell wall biosynthesis